MRMKILSSVVQVVVSVILFKLANSYFHFSLNENMLIGCGIAGIIYLEHR